MIGPRKDVISVDDCFMGIAILISQRSKDPNTQVGCVLVDKNNRIIGTGYNGFPKDIDNNLLPWDRVGLPEETKYLYVSHAESNAIDNCDKTRLVGSKIYTTLFPCNNCSIRLINNGISEIIYLNDKYHEQAEFIASRKMLDLAKIKYRKFNCLKKRLFIDLY